MAIRVKSHFEMRLIVNGFTVSSGMDYKITGVILPQVFVSEFSNNIKWNNNPFWQIEFILSSFISFRYFCNPVLKTFPTTKAYLFDRNGLIVNM